MNAVLQCFSNIKRLRCELLQKDNFNELEKNKLNNQKLSFALSNVIKNLWENTKLNVYQPKYFQKIIIEIYPNILKEPFLEPINLINFILNQMHRELRIVNIISNQNLFQNNFNDFDLYKKNYEINNNSIIIRLFNGYSMRIQKCIQCNNFINMIENFEFLNFSLNEVKNFKNDNTNYINIYDCFEYFEKIETIYQFCNNCSSQYNKQQIKLVYLPQILIINFLYEKNNQNNISIIFDESINLKKYILYNNESPYYYELIGVICRLNSEENQFIAFCKNSDYKCNWYKYHDDKVTKCSFNQILSNEYQIYTLFFSHINKF